jgi:serine/threonine protein kinase
MFELLSNRYYLEGRVGDASDAPFLAVDTYTDDAVAIVYADRPVVCGHKLLDERFRLGVDNASKLRHINIANLIEVGEDLGRAYLVYSQPKGKTLAQMNASRRTKLRLGAALTALDGVAAALDFAHSRSVAHGRLSGEQVFVGSDGAARVIGFGACAGDTHVQDATIRGDLRDFVALASRLVSSDPNCAAIVTHAATHAPASAAALMTALHGVTPMLAPTASWMGSVKRAAVAMFAMSALAAGAAYLMGAPTGTVANIALTVARQMLQL